MASLYEIDGRIWDVIQAGYALDEETGEFWDDSAFEALEMERNDKLEGCALFVKNMEANVEAIRNEEKKLAERRHVLERRAERMRDYIAASMVAFGDKQIDTARVALSLRKSEALVVLDADQIPAEYMVTKTTTAPDKAAMKKAIKAGWTVPGAAIETRHNLQVK
jgi:hypothetical protein